MAERDPRRALRGLALVAVLLFSAGIGVASVGAQDPAPPAITAANVFADPLPDDAGVAARQVVFRLELPGAPRCGTGVAYGFLIDADHDAATGASEPLFAPLGVDAQVSATCDPDSGTYTSAAGTVSLTQTAAGAVLEIRTTVAALPSVDFAWIAYARDDGSVVRVPAARDTGAWATVERAL